MSIYNFEQQGGANPEPVEQAGGGWQHPIKSFKNMLGRKKSPAPEVKQVEKETPEQQAGNVREPFNSERFKGMMCKNDPLLPAWVEFLKKEGLVAGSFPVESYDADCCARLGGYVVPKLANNGTDLEEAVVPTWHEALRRYGALAANISTQPNPDLKIRFKDWRNGVVDIEGRIRNVSRPAFSFYVLTRTRGLPAGEIVKKANEIEAGEAPDVYAERVKKILAIRELNQTWNRIIAGEFSQARYDEEKRGADNFRTWLGDVLRERTMKGDFDLTEAGFGYVISGGNKLRSVDNYHAVLEAELRTIKRGGDWDSVRLYESHRPASGSWAKANNQIDTEKVYSLDVIVKDPDLWTYIQVDSALKAEFSRRLADVKNRALLDGFAQQKVKDDWATRKVKEYYGKAKKGTMNQWNAESKRPTGRTLEEIKAEDDPAIKRIKELKRAPEVSPEDERERTRLMGESELIKARIVSSDGELVGFNAEIGGERIDLAEARTELAKARGIEEDASRRLAEAQESLKKLSEIVSEMELWVPPNNATGKWQKVFQKQEVFTDLERNLIIGGEAGAEKLLEEARVKAKEIFPGQLEAAEKRKKVLRERLEDNAAIISSLIMVLRVREDYITGKSPEEVAAYDEGAVAAWIEDLATRENKKKIKLNLETHKGIPLPDIDVWYKDQEKKLEGQLLKLENEILELQNAKLLWANRTTVLDNKITVLEGVVMPQWKRIAECVKARGEAIVGRVAAEGACQLIEDEIAKLEGKLREANEMHESLEIDLRKCDEEVEELNAKIEREKKERAEELEVTRGAKAKRNDEFNARKEAEKAWKSSKIKRRVGVGVAAVAGVVALGAGALGVGAGVSAGAKAWKDRKSSEAIVESYKNIADQFKDSANLKAYFDSELKRNVYGGADVERAEEDGRKKKMTDLLRKYAPGVNKNNFDEVIGKESEFGRLMDSIAQHAGGVARENRALTLLDVLAEQIKRDLTQMLAGLKDPRLQRYKNVEKALDYCENKWKPNARERIKKKLQEHLIVLTEERKLGEMGADRIRDQIQKGSKRQLGEAPEAVEAPGPEKKPEN